MVAAGELGRPMPATCEFDFEHATVELSHLYGYTDDGWTVTGPVDRPGGRGASTDRTLPKTFSSGTVSSQT